MNIFSKVMIIVIFSFASALGWIAFSHNPQTTQAEVLPQSVSPSPKARPDIPDLHHLLSLPPDEIRNMDIALMNLTCAAGLKGSEALDNPACLQTLDTWAGHIQKVGRMGKILFSFYPCRIFR